MPLDTAPFDGMLDSVACYERDGTIRYVNPATCRLFGRDREALLGANLWQLFPDAIGTAFHAAFQRVAAHGEPQQFDNYYPPFGRWFANHVYSAGDRIWVVGRDITDAKRATARLETLADSSRVFSGAAVDLATAFDTIARHVAQVLGDACIIRLLSLDGHRFEEPIGVWDQDPRVLQLLKDVPAVAASEGAGGEVIRTGGAVVVARADSATIASRIAPPERRLFAESLGIHSVMIVPLRASGDTLGIISVIRRAGGTPTAYDEADLKLLQDLADRAALVVNQWRTFQAVDEAREHFRELVENSPYAVAMLDRQMHYVFVSQRFLSDFEVPFSSEDIRGRSHYDVFPEISQAWKELHSRCLAGEVLREEEERFVRSNGTEHLIRWELRPWRNYKGEIGGILIFSEDIGEQKRSRCALERMERVFQHASWGVALATPDNRFIAVNDAFTAMHGGTVEGWKGRPLIDMFDDEWKVKLPTLAAHANATGRLTYESVHVHADGSKFPVRSHVTAFKDEAGNVLYRAANFEDISDFKRAEATLRRAILLRDEFLSIASHELRTPLTALELQIDGIGRMLESGATSGAQFLERLRPKVGMAARQLDRLTALVEDMLSVSRIEMGQLRLKLEAFELGALVRSVAERFGQQADRKLTSISVNIVREVSGRWDRTRIEQVISNLISNAIKYGDGKTVRVTLTTDLHQAFIQVADEGGGIADKDLRRIFERFERAASVNHYGGLGLGLYIANQIMRAHGGSIEVESRPGLGSTFIARLPLVVTEPTPLGTPVAKVDAADAPPGLETSLEVDVADLAKHEHLFVGNSPASELVRATDWSKTELGPPKTWPRSLVNAVNMILELPSPAIIFCGDQQVQIYNDGYSFIMGPRHPKYFGSPYRECWPDTYPQIIPLMRQVLDQGESIRIERTLFAVTRHGFYEEAYFTFTFSPLRDDSGAIIGIIQPITEVTDIVLSERRAETLRALSPKADSYDPALQAIQALETNPQDVPFAFIFVWDEATNSPVFVAPTEALQARASVANNFLDAVKQAIESMLPVVIEDTSPHLQGIHLGPWPQASHAALVVPMRRAEMHVPKGAFVFGLSSALRLDDQYRGFLELAAVQLQAALEVKVALQEAQARADKLAALDREKTAFFSNVSHEFRTPLTLILAPIESAVASEDKTLQGDDLSLVHRNASRLLKLVNTLLDFSRLEAGHTSVNPVPTDLAALTTGLASAFEPLFISAGIGFSVHCEPLPAAVLVDREMWEKIVLNLLSNAFKFTFQGQVEISLRALPHAVELAVSDTGTGIAPAELPRLFERFHRIEGAKGRSFEGSGIGLALVSELVKLHNGHVRVESREGVGSTFTVSLPFTSDATTEQRRLDQSPSTHPRAQDFVREASSWLPDTPALPHVSAVEGTSPAGAPSASASSGRSPSAGFNQTTSTNRARLLVADDSSDMRAYIFRLLSEQYEVTLVSNGYQALEVASWHAPDVILTDVMMPELDGFGLLKSLRSSPVTQDIPVIMLSARAGEEAREQGLKAGVDDYLVKPFSARELLIRVENVITLTRARKEASTTRLQQMERSVHFAEMFMGIVGHDLRNPLSSIVTAADALAESSGDVERDVKWASRIMRSAERMDRMIEQLLDFTRARLGNGLVVYRAQTNLVDLCRLVIDELETESSAPRISLVSYGDPVGDWDSDRLAQLFSNLLANAMVHGTADKPVTVRIIGTDTDTVRAEVHNFGAIPSELIPVLFEPFRSSGRKLSHSRGLGLGLYISRHIAQAHGGDLSVASSLDLETTFTVLLPRKQVM